MFLPAEIEPVFPLPTDATSVPAGFMLKPSLMDRWPEPFLDGTVCAESDTLQSGAQRAGVLR